VSTYLGFEVLDQAYHNLREAIGQAFPRQGESTGSAVGRSFWDDHVGQPLPSRSFEWYAPGRTKIAQLRTFLDARMGRVVPFWAPTYTGDLVLAAAALSGQSAIRVHATGYRPYLFPLPSRKHLALLDGNGTVQRRKVTLAIDNGDGTDVLSLDAALTADVAPATTLVCFLTLCRLGEDLVPIRWPKPGHAEATLPLVEVPREVPA
jgi:hypothetical protein